MNKKEKIKLFFKKRHERVSLSGLSVRFDWLLVLSLAFLIGISGLVYGAITYAGIVSGKAFEQDEVNVPEAVAEEKRVQIKQTVEILDRS